MMLTVLNPKTFVTREKETRKYMNAMKFNQESASSVFNRTGRKENASATQTSHRSNITIAFFCFRHANDAYRIWCPVTEYSSSRHFTHQNSSSIRFSMEQAAAIRTPSRLRMAARSMPRSSTFSMSRKSPTQCVTGRSVNWQRSFREGSGTVTWGSPR